MYSNNVFNELLAMRYFSDFMRFAFVMIIFTVSGWRNSYALLLVEYAFQKW